MNASTRSEAGCLVRTDYIRILRIVRDNPDIITSGIYRQFVGYKGGNDAVRRKIQELSDAGYIEISNSGWIRTHAITEKGVRALVAIDSVSNEVGL
ncbi:hypothetical protein JS82_05830 [Methanomassiliicoccaceae archaeon DOK]|nr:hypothetical protein JS82_05830 [Methanomassiliicoccaceae archaeon DOK]